MISSEDIEAMRDEAEVFARVKFTAGLAGN
ncbi:hypothetical protein ROJ8625_04080 [Roseivivax jejudonensis]|uniref:Uncharacterized protein n=1 Tax=Roseivivax jejudonensis TaxID=1529041 RepID=A0A1X7AB05_9RHOB|nr:hypothetical protein ROJ8625_04080 [Roseivivax jejudonensis]